MKKKITLIVVIAFVQAGFAQPILIQKYSDVSLGGSNTWNPEQRYDFTYNQDQNVVSENLFYYSGNQWQMDRATLNYYNGTLLTRSVSQTDMDGYAFKTEYEYDSDGKRSNEFFYNKDMLDENWSNQTLKHYSYVDGETEQELLKVWNEQYQVYKDSYKTTYSYPNDSVIITTSYIKTSQPAPNDWIFDKQKITTTQNDVLLHEQFYNYDQDSMAFMLLSEVHYDYSSVGVLDSVEYTETGPNGMEKNKVENYFYNPNGSKAYIVIHKKVAGNWRYDHRLRFVYSELGLTKKKENQLVIYPNPAIETVNLDCGNMVIKAAEIFDSNGMLVVHQENIVSGQSISISHLAGGRYTLCVFSVDSVFDQVFVKQ